MAVLPSSTMMGVLPLLLLILNSHLGAVKPRYVSLLKTSTSHLLCISVSKELLQQETSVICLIN